MYEKDKKKKILKVLAKKDVSIVFENFLNFFKHERKNLFQFPFDKQKHFID